MDADSTMGQDRVMERFWTKVQKGPGCWLWTASTRNRYGQFWFDGRTQPAHRVAWQLTYGPIQDVASKGRMREQKKTHCPQGHPYAKANLIMRGNGDRRCRICANRVEQARRPRHRADRPRRRAQEI